MVGVPSHVFQVVVLATGSNALLTIDGSLYIGKGRIGIDLSQKDGLELIHSGVGE
jgi:hypothetical protein